MRRRIFNLEVVEAGELVKSPTAPSDDELAAVDSQATFWSLQAAC